MVLTSNNIILIILVLLSIVLLFLLNYTLSKKKKQQLEIAFAVIFSLLIFLMISLILQLLCSERFNINPIYFDYLVYLAGSFLPVAFFFLALIFARTKIEFHKRYCLLFIIPVLSVLFLWTNDLHHLFYKSFSTNFNESVYGIWFYIYYYYTMILFGVSLVILMKYSIKNSGFFSKPAILILIGALIPIITNILGTINVIPISIYITPITFAFTVICLALALFKFSIFKATPIALQRVVDRMSDSYVVLNENHEISDFNQTFIDTFNVKSLSDFRGKIFTSFLSEIGINSNNFDTHIHNVEGNDKVENFELYISKIHKYFNIEITSIIADRQFLGILILFKDISQHVNDMQILKDNQDTLMENERLASLGQLIGGIAHNLKTPIMSIAGATEGLNDLIKEYDLSIGDAEVTEADHHDIAKDMSVWVEKIKGYTEYMSDIITTVKGQAVTLGTDEEYEFTIKELINRVDILMKHELKNAIIYLNVAMKTDENITIHGDINSLIQVINNMISNSIQAYNGKLEQNIDMIINTQDNNLVISIKDYAGGLPKKVKDKLFKEMVTTKGKNGTGLGLYMSYSNIKARFNGDITFETDNEGTTFNIILPL